MNIQKTTNTETSTVNDILENIDELTIYAYVLLKKLDKPFTDGDFWDALMIGNKYYDFNVYDTFDRVRVSVYPVITTYPNGWHETDTSAFMPLLELNESTNEIKVIQDSELSVNLTGGAQ